MRGGRKVKKRGDRARRKWRGRGKERANKRVGQREGNKGEKGKQRGATREERKKGKERRNRKGRKGKCVSLYLLHV